MATTIDGNSIHLIAKLIINSSARGCFIALLSEDGSPDEFRAFLRSQHNSVLMGTIENLLPSTYTILVYDIEENGVPNRNPAYELSNGVVINTTGKNPIYKSDICFEI